MDRGGAGADDEAHDTDGQLWALSLGCFRDSRSDELEHVR